MLTSLIIQYLEQELEEAKQHVKLDRSFNIGREVGLTNALEGTKRIVENYFRCQDCIGRESIEGIYYCSEIEDPVHLISSCPGMVHPDV